jgi:pimeloyl-ACP methyl ester carboxylesterase
VHLAALSWGAKLAVAAALEHPSDWQSLTLITPGLRALVDLPTRDKLSVAMSLFTGRTVRVPAPITPEMFTTTPRFLQYIQGDPWRTRTVTARFCLASRALDRRVHRRRARLAMPTLTVLAGHDRIIDNVAVVPLVRALRPDARVAVFAGASHAIQFDHTARLVDRMVRLVLGDVPSRSLP